MSDGKKTSSEDARVHGNPYASLTNINKLVVVCGHAICQKPSMPYNEESWLLQPFQRSKESTGKPGEHETFLQHISTGLTYISDDSTLLVFSGGKTQPNCELSEGESYRNTSMSSEVRGKYHNKIICKQFIAAECWATDSYQNLLFSIIEFWKYLGRWPELITVITHAFKQDRFLQYHSDALRWPRDRIRVQGINPPSSAGELQDVTKSEYECRIQFGKDPYGVREPLAGKRRQRRWDDRALNHVINDISDDSIKEVLEKARAWTGGESGRDPVADEIAKRQLKALLEWTGGESGRDTFPYPLPWDHLHQKCVNGSQRTIEHSDRLSRQVLENQWAELMKGPKKFEDIEAYFFKWIELQRKLARVNHLRFPTLLDNYCLMFEEHIDYVEGRILAHKTDRSLEDLIALSRIFIRRMPRGFKRTDLYKSLGLLSRG